MVRGIGHALQCKGNRLAVDENHPVVASGRDLRDVALHEGVAVAIVRQSLEHHVAILVALLQHEYRSAAHPVQRLAHRLAMLAQEFAHVMHIASDERRCAAFWEPSRVHLLVHVPEALRVVADQRALQASPLEDISAVDVLGVEGRVLAHEDDVVLT